MGVLSFNYLASSVCHRFHSIWHPSSNGLSEVPLRVPLLKRRFSSRFGSSRMAPLSKRFGFQDFQDFVKPQRLLPAIEANILEESSLNEIQSSNLDECCSYYIVQLQTSGDFGSSLSDPNSTLLLSLIDVNGDSILQILSAAAGNTVHLKEMDDPDFLFFQRGSIDKFIFKGAKLGDITACWISPSSGCWRLGGVSLTVLYSNQSSPSFTQENKSTEFNGLKYEFEASDLLLGEGAEMSMVELRPSHVMNFSGSAPDYLTLFGTGLSHSISFSNQKITSEESMKEYSNLKFSLLFYNAMLILGGTSIIAFSVGEESALAFLVGGVCGFLYLLVLQNSVDGLSTPALPAVNEKRFSPVQLYGRFKGPLSNLAFSLVSVSVVLKYGLGHSTVLLSPQELLVGIAGFFTCKIAVIAAAISPISASVFDGQNNQSE